MSAAADMETVRKMKRILCFGDSNTYGYDPRSYLGGRLPETVRWTGLLNAGPDWDIRNAGQNGREIPHTAAAYGELDSLLLRHAPLDGLVVMLGTNDLFCMFDPGAEAIAARMALLLSHVLRHPAVVRDRTKVLLAAPPPVDLHGDTAERRLSGISAEWGGHYGALAKRLGVFFADTGTWGIGFAFDGVHFSEEGHRTFARHMAAALSAMMEAPA